MMVIVYVIKSLVKNWIYVGITSNIEKRLYEHNYGLVRSTKAYRPFKLMYQEEVEDYNVARKRELYYKILQARNF